MSESIDFRIGCISLHACAHFVFVYLCIFSVVATTTVLLTFSLFPLPVSCAVNCCYISSATETIQLSKRPALERHDGYLLEFFNFQLF